MNSLLFSNLSGPSPNLSWKELACHDGTAYPIVFIDDGRVFELAAMFENIRSLCGHKPIIVLSAYRTSKWNSKVGGAKFSQHVEGRALDLKPPRGYTVNQFYDRIKSNADDFGIRGLGRYKTFVHVDIRPTNQLVAWSSTALKESV